MMEPLCYISKNSYEDNKLNPFKTRKMGKFAAVKLLSLVFAYAPQNTLVLVNLS